MMIITIYHRNYGESQYKKMNLKCIKLYKTLKQYETIKKRYKNVNGGSGAATI